MIKDLQSSQVYGDDSLFRPYPFVPAVKSRKEKKRVGRRKGEGEGEGRKEA